MAAQSSSTSSSATSTQPKTRPFTEAYNERYSHLQRLHPQSTCVDDDSYTYTNTRSLETPWIKQFIADIENEDAKRGWVTCFHGCGIDGIFLQLLIEILEPKERRNYIKPSTASIVHNDVTDYINSSDFSNGDVSADLRPYNRSRYMGISFTISDKTPLESACSFATQKTGILDEFEGQNKGSQSFIQVVHDIIDSYKNYYPGVNFTSFVRRFLGVYRNFREDTRQINKLFIFSIHPSAFDQAAFLCHPYGEITCCGSISYLLQTATVNTDLYTNKDGSLGKAITDAGKKLYTTPGFDFNYFWKDNYQQNPQGRLLINHPCLTYYTLNQITKELGDKETWEEFNEYANDLREWKRGNLMVTSQINLQLPPGAVSTIPTAAPQTP
jgi:hypothetical protein